MSEAPLSPARRTFNQISFVVMLIGLPLFVWYALVAVKHYDGSIIFPDAEFWSHVPAPNLLGFAVYIGWLAFQAALYHWLPGRLEQGQPLPDGKRLPYTLNGLWSFVITIGLWSFLHITGVVSGAFLYENLETILASANVVVFALCGYIFWLGRKQATPTERKRNALEAFFMGAARNPRDGRFDWKFFCESRPGLTLWVLVALSCMVHQHETYGTVTNAMVLAAFMIGLYIVDYYIHEEAVLTTWDMVHEPFGWMLCWGSLIYVPFFYPLAAIWLADHHYALPWWGAVSVLVIGVTGYVIFRQCNIQKHRFRKDPTTKIWGKPPVYIQTERGTKLLTSGWWGVASHANYLGDLMIALSMGLTVGASTLWGYGYFLAFVVLLIHREWRDNQHCAAKYGNDWKAYRAQVKWRIVPGIY